MTKIKLCGLSRACDIDAVNELCPDYIGFIFAKWSKRCVTPERAAELKAMLNKEITAVGVFVNEPLESVAELLGRGIIDAAQLHGQEDENYIAALRELTDKKIIKAFRMETPEDAERANASGADYILLDSGIGGTGTVFNWELTQKITRPYFLAGGLNPDNVKQAVERLRPFAVDVGSGIETDGLKDREKMARFVCAVRSIGERI